MIVVWSHFASRPPYPPEKYREWITKVDWQLKQAAQNNVATAEWLDDEDFSMPCVMIEVRGFMPRDARNLAQIIANKFFTDLPKEDRVFINVYDADSLEEIFSEMYDRKKS